MARSKYIAESSEQVDAADSAYAHMVTLSAIRFKALLQYKAKSTIMYITGIASRRRESQESGAELKC